MISKDAVLAEAKVIAPLVRAWRPQEADREVLTIAVIATVSAFLAVLAGCSPIGFHFSDSLVTGLFAAGVVALASRAKPMPGATAATVALLFGSWPLRVVALVALALIVPSLLRQFTADRFQVGSTNPFELTPLLAVCLPAVSAGLSTQVLLRLPFAQPSRMSALIAIVGLAWLCHSGWQNLKPQTQQIGMKAAKGIAIFCAVGAVSGVIFGLLSIRSLDRGGDASHEGLAQLRKGQHGEAKESFDKAADSLNVAHLASGGIWAWPARHTPLVAQQIQAVDAIAGGGAKAAREASDAADGLDASGLRVVDGRIDPKAVAKVRPVLTDVSNSLSELKTHLEERDNGRVWQLPPVANGLDRVTSAVDRASGSVHTASLAAEVGPELLGEKGAKTYFVGFVSPSESRATGFLGNYGILKVDAGQVDLEAVGRNDDLDEAGAEALLTGPKEYLDRYAKFEPATTWENLTVSPDVPTVGQVAAELYPQAGGSEIDGVLLLDPTGLAALLKLTGPVQVEGMSFPLTSKNAINFLEVDQYRLFSVADQRSDLLGEVAEAVFDKLVKGEGPAPAALGDALGPAVANGHVTAWLKDARGQKLMAKLGLSGAVAKPEGDAFGLITQNAGGGKIDVFMQRSIDYGVEVDSKTGDVKAKADIELRNDAPTSGQPAYLIDNLVDLPKGTNRTWVSIYSPFDLKHLAVNGRPVEVKKETEFGRNVWSFFVEIPSMTSTSISVEFSGNIDPANGYYLDWMNQTMVNPDNIQGTVEFSKGSVETGDVRREPPGGIETEGSVATFDGGTEQGPWSLQVKRR